MPEAKAQAPWPSGVGLSHLHELVVATAAGLPPATGRVLLLHALGGGSPDQEVRMAAERLGLTTASMEPARAVGLIEATHPRPQWRHALIAEVLIAAADPTQVELTHRALADAVHITSSEDLAGMARQAWHRVAAAGGHDEGAADGLEVLAAANARRGASAEAFTALRGAADLSANPTRRVHRLSQAAKSAHEGGLNTQAAETLQEAFASASEPSVVRELAVTEWRLAYSTGTVSGRTIDDMVRLSTTIGAEAADEQLRILVAAATRGWFFDADAPARARVQDALLPAPNHLLSSTPDLTWSPTSADTHAARRRDEDRPENEESPDPKAHSVARQIARPDPTQHPSPQARDILKTTVLALTGPPRSGAQYSRYLAAAATVVTDELPQLLPACAIAAEAIHDLPTAALLWDTAATTFHQSGLLIDEVLALAGRAGSLLWRGQLDASAATATSSLQMASDLGLDLLGALAASVLAGTRAWQGHAEYTQEAIERVHSLNPSARCLPAQARSAWSEGILALSDDRPSDALRKLRQVRQHPTIALWAIADLTEAAIGADDLTGIAGQIGEARRLASAMSSSHLQALVCRAYALLAGDDAAADRWFRASLVAGVNSQAPLELARSRLAYGLWLRRKRRLGEAAVLTAAAVQVFSAAGAPTWLQRAQAA